GLIAQIDSLRSRLYNDQTNRIDYEVANDFIGVCEIYGLLLPADQHTPDYLHEAAKTAGYIRSFPKALELYEWLYEKYPTHEKAAQALFMMGFTYDNEIKDIDKAKELYEAFIEKYPDNDFADDARFLLENLGKSDEEIISSFGNE
ncbi:MAG: tetratricopeptide repeat protein, partial [Saprospiraceae bacterium]|nr:tetratricopeptide repeat protein [Saprospiraceae bacterium]